LTLIGFTATVRWKIYLGGKALYPMDWQTAWLNDRSVTIYNTVIAALTVLVIAAMLIRG